MIEFEIERGNIIIEPFDRSQLGPNSYDLRLGNKLLYYKNEQLDPRKENETEEVEIPKDGIVLNPGSLYLGSTLEYTSSGVYHPCITGKSSLARLGVNVHVTAGFGDVGFRGHWTLEIFTVGHWVRLYPGMKIAQLYFNTVAGKVKTPYHERKVSKYSDQAGKPIPSLYHTEKENG